MLIRYPRTVMVNKENYYQEYTVYAKYQTVSAKAVVQVDFSSYALLSTNQTPLKKQKRKKMVKVVE